MDENALARSGPPPHVVFMDPGALKEKRVRDLYESIAERQKGYRPHIISPTYMVPSWQVSHEDRSLKEVIEDQDKNIVHLEELVKELQEANGKLMKMIEAMWFAPGMPGAPETPDHPSFKK